MLPSNNHPVIFAEPPVSGPPRLMSHLAPEAKPPEEQHVTSQVNVQQAGVTAGLKIEIRVYTGQGSS